MLENSWLLSRLLVQDVGLAKGAVLVDSCPGIHHKISWSLIVLRG